VSVATPPFIPNTFAPDLGGGDGAFRFALATPVFANLAPATCTSNHALTSMPFPVTQRERVALAVLGLLIVLGLLGMVLL
jgi:hypothetical protein